jgi:predicted  nucleic acid-binding Zn ribbon protein
MLRQSSATVPRVASVTDIYAKLRVPQPTPEDELCSCPGTPPIKLMTMRQVAGFNPLHCLDCNLEVPPERLSLTADLAEEIASWDWEHGALETLELASGEYEDSARSKLLDPVSPTNTEGRRLAQKISALRPCYFWFFQPQSDEDWQPRATCPVCNEPMERYEKGIFPQLLCEQDRLVLVG